MELLNVKERGKSPIVDSWMFMTSELPILCVITSYLVIVIFLAPKFMKNRPAYSLTYVTRAYNIFQVLACVTIVTNFYQAGWTFAGALSCESHLPSKNYTKLLETWWLCVFIRLAEFLETLFFILRKKNSQVTFLHCYHHVSSLFIVWIPLKYGGNLGWLIHGCVNAKVHVLMYSYYLLTTFKNTKLQKMTRVAKPFITALQITQLVALAIHCVYALNKHCSFGSKLYAVHLTNLSILIFNFAKFYLEAYQQKKPKTV